MNFGSDILVNDLYFLYWPLLVYKASISSWKDRENGFNYEKFLLTPQMDLQLDVGGKVLASDCVIIIAYISHFCCLDVSTEDISEIISS